MWACIVWACADGLENMAVAEQLGLTKQTVAKTLKSMPKGATHWSTRTWPARWV